MLDILICTIPGGKFHTKTKATFLLLFSHSVMFNFCSPMDGSPRGSSVRGISKQGYWSGLPFPCPGDLPNPGFEPMSPALAGRFFTTEPPGKPEATY